MRALPVLAAALALGAAPAAAGTEAPSGSGVNLYPWIEAEVESRLFSVSTTSASERNQRGTNIFLRGELEATLHLSPQWSIEGAIDLEPISEVEPKGARQASAIRRPISRRCASTGNRLSA
jgi:hypothetical protein